MSFLIRKEEIDTPALIIDMDIFEKNIQIMNEYYEDKVCRLRPHFKTAKSIEIVQKGIEAGAKGITCSKVSEAEVLAKAGVKDILVANQIVDRSKISRLADIAKKSVKVTIAVDNIENINSLSEIAVKAGVEFFVLVEVDIGMNRCGVDSETEVLYLAKAVDRSKNLVFEGLQAYEGHLCFQQNKEEKRKAIIEIEEKLLRIKKTLVKNGLYVNEISGGGTGTYDLKTDNKVWTEMQAGSYVFMDNTYNKVKHLPFKNSLTVLTTVIHKRDGIAITDAGKKACINDSGNTSIKDHPEIDIVLNEEHGILTDPSNDLKYLQKIEYIPGHCCTTVNLYDKYHCVRKGVLECIWPIEGRGKSQ